MTTKNVNLSEDEQHYYSYRLLPVRNRKKYKRKIVATISVQVGKARGLPRLGSSDNCNYCVKLEMRNGVLLDSNTNDSEQVSAAWTKLVPRTNATWNETFRWNIRNPHEDGKDELIVTLYASKSDGDMKEVGQATLYLRTGWFDGYRMKNKAEWQPIGNNGCNIMLSIEQKDLFKRSRIDIHRGDK
jgi:hypothetical protein